MDYRVVCYLSSVGCCLGSLCPFDLATQRYLSAFSDGSWMSFPSIRWHSVVNGVIEENPYFNAQVPFLDNIQFQFIPITFA